MENLADLEKKYEELGKEIERLKEQQNTGRVKEGNIYYFIDSDGDIIDTTEDFYDSDDRKYELGNYFKTEAEAEKVVGKIEIYMELKRLAERLNNGKKIDWKDDDQEKYLIGYNYCGEKFESDRNYWGRRQGTIYCLDKNFKDIAIKEIGEDRLKKLFE